MNFSSKRLAERMNRALAWKCTVTRRRRRIYHWGQRDMSRSHRRDPRRRFRRRIRSRPASGDVQSRKRNLVRHLRLRGNIDRMEHARALLAVSHVGRRSRRPTFAADCAIEKRNARSRRSCTRERAKYPRSELIKNYLKKNKIPMFFLQNMFPSDVKKTCLKR